MKEGEYVAKTWRQRLAKSLHSHGGGSYRQSKKLPP